METIESYVFYRSFHEALAELDIKDYGKLMYAINEYALNNNDEKVNALTGVLKSLWTLIKPQLDANHRRREVGFKGGRPAKNNTEKKPMVFENDENKKPMVIFSNTEKKPNVNVNVNSNKNNNVNVNGETTTNTTTSTTTIPTLNDVKKFVKDQGLTVSAAKFFTHYNMKNWEGVTNWQLALIHWDENQFQKTEKKSSSSKKENDYCRDAKEVLAELKK